MDNFSYAVALAFLAVALIVAVGTWAYDFAVARIFGDLVRNETQYTSDEFEKRLEVAREGVRWASRNRFEINVWAAVLFVVALISGGGLAYRHYMY